MGDSFFPGNPDARQAGAAGGIDLLTSPCPSRASHLGQQIGVWDQARTDENRGAANDRAIVEFDPAEEVIVHDELGDADFDDSGRRGR